MSIQFVDSTSAATPLPAGISVTVTQGSTTIGTGTTNGSGVVSISVTQGQSYTAAFSGTNAPTTTQAFIGGSNQSEIVTDSGNAITDDSGNPLVATTGTTTTVPVAGYTSPAVTNARATQVLIEPLVTATSRARATQILVEPLVIANSNARATQVLVEVLIQVVPQVVSIAVTPATSSVEDGQTEQFTAMATYSNGDVVDVTTVASWSATYGTVSSSGLYTAPASRSGNDTVSAEVNGITGTATVTDTVEFTLEISPSAIAIATNATQQFVASLVGSDGSSTPETVTWTSTAGGSITPTGLFTAGPNPTSAVTLTATYAGSQTYTATAVVSIVAAQTAETFAQQGVTGYVSLDLPLGGDFTLTPQGNILLATDTPGNPRASEQFLERVVFTQPTRRDGDGNPIGPADDIFNPNFGAGLPGLVGELADQTLSLQEIQNARSSILNAIAQSPRFTKSPAPTCTISSPVNGYVLFTVSATTVSGVIVTFPSIKLKVVS